MKRNCSNARAQMIFNNVFYDITQFDIQSEFSRRTKPLRTNTNNSVKKNGSNERSLHLSNERSQKSAIATSNYSRHIFDKSVKQVVNPKESFRFQSPEN